MEGIHCAVCALVAITLFGCAENNYSGSSPSEPSNNTSTGNSSSNCGQPVLVACAVRCASQGKEYGNGTCDEKGHYNCICQANTTNTTGANGLFIAVNTSDNSSMLLMMRSGSVVSAAPLSSSGLSSLIGALPGITSSLGGAAGSASGLLGSIASIAGSAGAPSSVTSGLGSASGVLGGISGAIPAAGGVVSSFGDLWRQFGGIFSR